MLDEEAFKYCDGSGYQVLDLKGPQGDSGAAGQDGAGGTDGRSIIWQGELSSAPSSPDSNWAYYNTSDRAAYIYDGSEWDTLSVSGADGNDGADGAKGDKGDSFYWLGSFSSAPTSPALNEAYYNTTDSKAYIWDGDSWELLVQDGTNGIDGADGTPGADGTNGTDGSDGAKGDAGTDGADGSPGADGISIIWKGSLASAPASPDTNWAYYNSTDKVSCIWNGTSWDTLSVSGADGTKGDKGDAGTDGISLNWLGSFPTAPSTPSLNDAYYNTTDGDSYIWDGTSWAIISQGNPDGAPSGMVLIPSGSFVDDAATGWTGDIASISYNFYMDTTEVTQGDYDGLMSDATYGYSAYSSPAWSSTFGVGADYPVYYVNWYDAVLYCNARSKRDGKDTVYTWSSISGTPGNDCTLNGLGIDLLKKGYRLPTEDEWELAARVGQQLEYPTDDGTLDNTKANYEGNIGKATVVGSYPANPYGLYDMAGNLWEWCNDWYGTTGRVDGRMNYVGNVSGSYRVLRGGSWSFNASLLRSAYRYNDIPGYEDFDIGFRVALPAQ